MVAAFDGGEVTSDAGGLLLGATDRAIGLVRRFAACFDDGRARRRSSTRSRRWWRSGCSASRSATRTSSTTISCATTRCWRRSPASSRRGARSARRSPARARSTGSSTRLRSRTVTTRSAMNAAAIEGLFVNLFLEAHKTPPKEIILDLDATDDPCMAIRRAASSTAITTAIATCRCTSFVAGTCSPPSCGARTSMPRPGGRRGRAHRRPDPGALAPGRDPATGRFRLCPRRADGVVRGEWRRLPLWPRPQRAAGRRDRRGARRSEAESLAQGAPARRFADSRGARSTAGAGRAGSSPRPSTCPKGQTHASSSLRCRRARSTPAPSTRTSIAPAARSRTGSRSSSSTCSPTAPRRRPCAPTSSGSGSRPSPTS